MGNPFGQSSRIGELKTPLGENALVLTRFSGREEMSAPFIFEVEALHAQEPGRTIAFDDALGKTCTVTLRGGGQKRCFAGTLVETRRVEAHPDGALYGLTLRPWFWMLNKRVNSRIFHEKSVTQIISDIFDAHGGMADYEDHTSQSYPTLEYCVQHNESDFAFVSRLAEAHGIGYFFAFDDDKQTMVLSDSRSSYADAPGGKRPFQPVAGDVAEYFTDWRGERRFTTGKVRLNDYNFKKPSTNMEAEKSGDASHDNASLESYLHPGKYMEPGDGSTYAQAAMNAARAEDGRFLAAGVCPGLAPGSVTQLSEHPEGGEYLVLECTHRFFGQAYRSMSGEPEPEDYYGEYVLLPADRSYAPPPATAKPVIAGPQTAVVVSDCDEHGRIKVRFHWTSDGESMWCRVAQSWAGVGWGAIFLPRIGMEVLVEFIDGDPDYPVIIGSVYNGENTPPYPLPDKQSISGFKSETWGGGGYNEFIMDDSSGAELVRLHAQRDYEGDIVHDRTVKIGNDETLTIDNNRTTKIASNDTLTVFGKLDIEAKTSITLHVGSNSIVIDQSGIKIEALQVTVEASGALMTKAGGAAKHESGGVMVIQGAVIKIN